MKSLNELLKKGEEILEKSLVADAKLDAWLLMEHVFNISKSEYLLNREQKPKDSLAEEYLRLISIRTTHKPVQHIIGTQEFMGLEFIVNEDVLIPRQDTELLVEETINLVNNLDNQNLSILDMCTGSGCIAICLAKYLNVHKVVGADISRKALEIAKKNALNNVVDCEFIESDLFKNIGNRYDIIVSNPPYIQTYEINNLMSEVKDHEPVNALDGGEDGLEYYRLIADMAREYFYQRGYLLFEIGYDEAESVINILQKNGYVNIKLYKDLAGLDRVITAQYS